eukprot:COSAG05_NODE_1325_length_5180_cov_5.433576_6_plen_75_part_00
MHKAATMSREHCELAKQQSRELLMVLGKDDSAAAAAAHKEKLRSRTPSSGSTLDRATKVTSSLVAQPVGVVSGI